MFTARLILSLRGEKLSWDLQSSMHGDPETCARMWILPEKPGGFFSQLNIEIESGEPVADRKVDL